MRTHTQAFKDGIKQYGRQFNDVLSFNDGQNNLILISKDKINRINYSVDTTLMKSVMQTMTIDINSNVDIDVYNKLQYGISLVGDNTNISFRYFNVTKKEEQKDKKSYIYTCYDNMIKAMVDYESLGVTYPITIRDYLIAICSHLGLTFKNASDTFTNYNKQVTSEHYIDSDGNKMGYTFRDVLDDLAEAVGGFICIDNTGKLEIRYISNAVGTKNLFNSYLYNSMNNTTKNNVTLSIQNDGGIKLVGTSSISGETNFALGGWATTTTIIPLDSSKTYTISVKGNTRNEVGFHLRGVKNGTSTKILYASDTSSKATITGFTSISYISAIIYGNKSSDTILYLQIEEGNQATDYEPYYDTINEDYFSDKNVNIGKQIAYNTLVLSRASDSDNIHRPTTLPQEPIELKISDNAILDQDNREDFIDGIFNQINGLEFYLNDFATTSILYYEIGDKYNVSIGDTIYPCLMLSDDIKRTTGLKENIVTKEPKQSVTPYKYSSTTDKVEIASRNAKILVDKANASIEQIVEAVGDNGEVTSASIVQAINDDTSSIKLEADKIDINGVVSANNSFAIDTNGNMSCNNANITGGYLSLTDYASDPEDRFIITSEDGTKVTTATSEYVITRSLSDNYNYAQMSLNTGFSYSSGTSTTNSNSRLRGGYLTLNHKENGTTTTTQIGTDTSIISGDVTISGNLYVNNELNSKNSGDLYIGYRNTTGIDFLRGKVTIDSNGNIYSNNKPVNDYQYWNPDNYLVNSWSSNGVSNMIKINGVKILQFSVRQGTSVRVTNTLPDEMKPNGSYLVMATNLAQVGYVLINASGQIEVSSNIFTSGASNLVFTAIYL